MKKYYFIYKDNIDMLEACFSTIGIEFSKFNACEHSTLYIIDTKREIDIINYFDDNYQNYELAIRRDRENKNVRTIKVTPKY
jgi:hypothetical protein